MQILLMISMLTEYKCDIKTKQNGNKQKYRDPPELRNVQLRRANYLSGSNILNIKSVLVSIMWKIFTIHFPHLLLFDSKLIVLYPEQQQKKP